MSHADERAVIALFHQLASGVVPSVLRHIPRKPLPAALQEEAQTVGSEHDSNSLEQGK